MKRILLVLVVMSGLLAALALKGSLLALPAAGPSASGFDANRAHQRLARILGDERPHPVDSAANDAVRERLIAEMRAVGLNPRITDDFACNGRRGSAVACARVRNLVATIGPAEGRHLLLVSHYDSTPAGPGAADDGIGVATMLEVAMALRGRALARPVTFLINEGEEFGLIGARAFMERDPLAAQVDVAINLEARGVNGPAIMFETSRPNAAAIALYRAAVAPAGRQFALDRPLCFDPQFDRRHRLRRPALDDPQLRGDRQRDALSQRRRHACRARSRAASSIWASRRSRRPLWSRPGEAPAAEGDAALYRSCRAGC